MKCKKCGSDTLIKKDDWYKCANCGATIFDTEVQINNVTSPTKEIERIEKSNPVKKENIVTYTPKEEPKPVTSEQNINSDTKKRKKNKKDAQPKSKIRETIEFCAPIVSAVIIAILLKYLVFANVVVPTGSMLNTIHEGDRIIASRLSYINSEPERYDIVIFEYPDQDIDKASETIYYVKRVIGLPGETVQIVNGVTYVTQTNGEIIQLDDSFITNCEPTGDFGPYKVPEGHYFMLGDNRNNSWDSRYWHNKYVKANKIVGKVKFRYYPGFEKVE